MNARMCPGILFAFFTSPLAAQIDLDARVPPGGGSAFNLQSVVFNGSGCPQGQGTSYQIQGDVLWIKFPDQLTAESGLDSSPADRRKNCIATVRFANSLQTYAIESIAFAGYASLSDDASATIQTSWSYEGQGQTGSLSFTREGPAEGQWISNFSQPIHPTQLLWKPCALDRALNINSSVLVSGASTDHALANLQVVGLRFKRKNCLGIGY